ncbi:MAG TPA: ABC transporter ATP-binding protein [Candidatus Limnocylindrales bacterium]|nr:ABC transporter ATP-binding protein [Candidatus Limnocylindrales bacterium]
MSFLLNVQRLSKSFRGLRAVTTVSFEVENGATVALIGPNGAGKTTIFNMVAGALRPDDGAILFAGKPINGLRPDQICVLGIGRTFQIVKPFAGLSVLDNAIVGALRCCVRVDEARAFASTIIDKLGLGAKRDFPASSLTLPDRKKLEIARALATRPKLLLLDEVMAGLRPLECDQLIAFLQEINQRDGVTILLIEHVMRAVMALAHKVIVLHHGEMIAQGSPAHVVLDAAVLECYLGEDLEL